MLKKKPKGVYLIPGSCYNKDFEYHMRIRFGDDPALFKPGLKVLNEGIREYRG